MTALMPRKARTAVKTLICTAEVSMTGDIWLFTNLSALRLRRGLVASCHNFETWGADAPVRDTMLIHNTEPASFTDSAMFDRTFDEGMALVEETARYLDGKGREEARILPRKAAMLYAGESMRVTTRLMQAASWLLVQRAVRDGDMERDDALNERYRLGSREICLGTCAEDCELAP